MFMQFLLSYELKRPYQTIQPNSLPFLRHRVKYMIFELIYGSTDKFNFVFLLFVLSFKISVLLTISPKIFTLTGSMRCCLSNQGCYLFLYICLYTYSQLTIIFLFSINNIFQKTKIWWMWLSQFWSYVLSRWVVPPHFFRDTLYMYIMLFFVMIHKNDNEEFTINNNDIFIQSRDKTPMTIEFNFKEENVPWVDITQGRIHFSLFMVACSAHIIERSFESFSIHDAISLL